MLTTTTNKKKKPITGGGIAVLLLLLSLSLLALVVVLQQQQSTTEQQQRRQLTDSSLLLRQVIVEPNDNVILAPMQAKHYEGTGTVTYTVAMNSNTTISINNNSTSALIDTTILEDAIDDCLGHHVAFRLTAPYDADRRQLRQLRRNLKTAIITSTVKSAIKYDCPSFIANNNSSSQQHCFVITQDVTFQIPDYDESNNSFIESLQGDLNNGRLQDCLQDNDDYNSVPYIIKKYNAGDDDIDSAPSSMIDNSTDTATFSVQYNVSGSVITADLLEEALDCLAHHVAFRLSAPYADRARMLRTSDIHSSILSATRFECLQSDSCFAVNHTVTFDIPNDIDSVLFMQTLQSDLNDGRLQDCLSSNDSVVVVVVPRQVRKGGSAADTDNTAIIETAPMLLPGDDDDDNMTTTPIDDDDTTFVHYDIAGPINATFLEGALNCLAHHVAFRLSAPYADRMLRTVDISSSLVSATTRFDCHDVDNDSCFTVVQKVTFVDTSQQHDIDYNLFMKELQHDLDQGRLKDCLQSADSHGNKVPAITNNQTTIIETAPSLFVTENKYVQYHVAGPTINATALQDALNCLAHHVAFRLSAPYVDRMLRTSEISSSLLSATRFDCPTSNDDDDSCFTVIQKLAFDIPRDINETLFMQTLQSDLNEGRLQDCLDGDDNSSGVTAVSPPPPYKNSTVMIQKSSGAADITAIQQAPLLTSNNSTTVEYEVSSSSSLQTDNDILVTSVNCLSHYVAFRLSSPLPNRRHLQTADISSIVQSTIRIDCPDDIPNSGNCFKVVQEMTYQIPDDDAQTHFLGALQGDLNGGRLQDCLDGTTVNSIPYLRKHGGIDEIATAPMANNNNNDTVHYEVSQSNINGPLDTTILMASVNCLSHHVAFRLSTPLPDRRRLQTAAISSMVLTTTRVDCPNAIPNSNSCFSVVQEMTYQIADANAQTNFIAGLQDDLNDGRLQDCLADSGGINSVVGGYLDDSLGDDIATAPMLSSLEAVVQYEISQSENDYVDTSALITSVNCLSHNVAFRLSPLPTDRMLRTADISSTVLTATRVDCPGFIINGDSCFQVVQEMTYTIPNENAQTKFIEVLQHDLQEGRLQDCLGETNNVNSVAYLKSQSSDIVSDIDTAPMIMDVSNVLHYDISSLEENEPDATVLITAMNNLMRHIDFQLHVKHQATISSDVLTTVRIDCPDSIPETNSCFTIQHQVTSAIQDSVLIVLQNDLDGGQLDSFLGDSGITSIIVTP